jgi:hypothetical protein
MRKPTVVINVTAFLEAFYLKVVQSVYKYVKYLGNKGLVPLLRLHCDAVSFSRYSNKI